MVAHYFDSSAIMKRYVTEVGSDWVNNQLGLRNAANYTVIMTGVEITCALARRLDSATAAALIRAFTRDFAEMYHRVHVTEALVQSAMRLGQKHRLRGYDAVQLAAAVSVAAEYTSDIAVTFISADTELCAAASVEGLTVENPNEHP